MLVDEPENFRTCVELAQRKVDSCKAVRGGKSREMTGLGMSQQPRECFARLPKLTNHQIEMSQVALNRRRCLRVTACRRGVLGAVDQVPGLVELAVKQSHDAAVQEDGSGQPDVWSKFEDVLGDITMAAGFIKSSSLSFQNGDRVVKVRSSLAQSGTLNHTPDIRKSTKNVVCDVSVYEESKEMEVCPGKKVSVTGFLSKTGCPLSMPES